METNLDHVGNSGLGSTELRNVLAPTVPDGKLDLVSLGRLDDAHVHVHVLQALLQDSALASSIRYE